MEGMWERFGDATLHSPLALQKNISTREAMEFNFLNVQYILDTLVDSLATLAQKQTFLAPRYQLVENASGKSARVLWLCVTIGNARGVRSDKHNCHEVGESSATRRDNLLEKDNFEVPPLLIPRQSRRDLDVNACGDKTTCFIDLATSLGRSARL